MSNWQDISTAPKDGTLILIWDGMEIHTAYWGPRASSNKQNLWVSNGCIDDWMAFAPTHWMPLPERPK